MATNCDEDWYPTPLFNGNASPLQMAKGRKPRPLGLLASARRAPKPAPKAPPRRR